MDTGIDKDIIDNMRQALSKAYVPENLIVYRGTDLNAISSYLQYDGMGNVNYNAMKGIIITDAGFMSTSIVRHSAFVDKVTWKVYVPAGINAAYLENITQFPGEYELLFNSGQKLIVKDIISNEEGNLNLILEAIK